MGRGLKEILGLQHTKKPVDEEKAKRKEDKKKQDEEKKLHDEAKKRYEGVVKDAESLLESAQNTLNDLKAFKHLPEGLALETPKGTAQSRISSAKQRIDTEKLNADQLTTDKYNAASTAIEGVDCQKLISDAQSAADACKQFHKALNKAYEGLVKLQQNPDAKPEEVREKIRSAHTAAGTNGDYVGGTNQLESCKELIDKASTAADEVKAKWKEEKKRYEGAIKDAESLLESAQKTLDGLEALKHVPNDLQTPKDPALEKVALAKNRIGAAKPKTNQPTTVDYKEASDQLESVDCQKLISDAQSATDACKQFHKALDKAYERLVKLQANTDANLEEVQSAILLAHNLASTVGYEVGTSQLDTCKELVENASIAAGELKSARDRFEKETEAASKSLGSLKKHLDASDYQTVATKSYSLIDNVRGEPNPTVEFYDLKAEALKDILAGAKTDNAEKNRLIALDAYNTALVNAKKRKEEVDGIPNCKQDLRDQISTLIVDHELSKAGDLTTEEYSKAKAKLDKSEELLRKAESDLDKQEKDFKKLFEIERSRLEEADEILNSLVDVDGLDDDLQTPKETVRHKIDTASAILNKARRHGEKLDYVTAKTEMDETDAFKQALSAANHCKDYRDQLALANGFLVEIKQNVDVEWTPVYRAIAFAHAKAERDDFLGGLADLKNCKKLAAEAAKAAEKLKAARERFETARDEALVKLQTWDDEQTVDSKYIKIIQSRIDELSYSGKSPDRYDELARAFPALFTEEQSKHNYEHALEKANARLSKIQTEFKNAVPADWKGIEDRLEKAATLYDEGEYESAIKELNKTESLFDKFESSFQRGGSQEKADLKAQPEWAKQRRKLEEGIKELTSIGATDQIEQLNELLSQADELASKKRYERAHDLLAGEKKDLGDRVGQFVGDPLGKSPSTPVEKLIKEGKAFSKQAIAELPKEEAALYNEIVDQIKQLETVAPKAYVDSAKEQFLKAIQDKALAPLRNQFTIIYKEQLRFKDDSDRVYGEISKDLAEKHFDIDDLTVAYKELRPLESQRSRNEFSASYTNLQALQTKISKFASFTDEQLKEATVQRLDLNKRINFFSSLPAAKDENKKLLGEMEKIENLARMRNLKEASTQQEQLAKDVLTFEEKYANSRPILSTSKDAVEAIKTKRGEINKQLDELAKKVDLKMAEKRPSERQRQPFVGEFRNALNTLFLEWEPKLQTLDNADQINANIQTANEKFDELMNEIKEFAKDDSKVKNLAEEGLTQEKDTAAKARFADIESLINNLRETGDKASFAAFSSRHKQLVIEQAAGTVSPEEWNALHMEVESKLKDHAKVFADAKKRTADYVKAIEKSLGKLKDIAGDMYEKYIDSQRMEVEDLKAYASNANQSCFDDANTQLAVMQKRLEDLVEKNIKGNKAPSEETFKSNKKTVEEFVKRIKEIKFNKTTKKDLDQRGISLIAKIGELAPGDATKEIAVFEELLNAAITSDEKNAAEESKIGERCDRLKKKLKTEVAPSAPMVAATLKATLKELTFDQSIPFAFYVQKANSVLDDVEQVINSSKDEIKPMEEEILKEQSDYEYEVRLFYSDYETFKKNLLHQAEKAINNAKKPDEKQFKHLKSYAKQVEKMLPPPPENRSLKEKAGDLFGSKAKPGKVADLIVPRELLTKAIEAAQRIIMMPEGAAVLGPKQMKLARQRWQDAVLNFTQGVDALNNGINEYCSKDNPPGNMQRGKEITKKVEDLKNMFSAAAFDESVDQLLKKDDVGTIHKKAREQGLAVLRRYVDAINDPLIQAVANDKNPFGRLNVQISALHFALKSLQLALLVNG